MEKVEVLRTRLSSAIRFLIVCVVALATTLPGLAQITCFDLDPSPAVYTVHAIFTNNTWLWEGRTFQANIFVPITGNSCSNVCSFSNLDVTITGAALLSANFSPQQLPPEGGLVILDCIFLQNPGATNATITIQTPCLGFNGSYNFPQFVPLTIGLETEPEPGVSLCWNTTSNMVYQVQYTGDPTSGVWYGLLGTNVTGYGTNTCVSDPASATSRFYRVITVP